MNRTTTHSPNKPDWLLRLGLLLCAVGLSLGAYLALSGSATSAEGARGAPAAAPKLVTKPIEQVRVGERVVGRNPLREQVAYVEPDPATWRQVSLFLTKESGNGLWIELLRPLTWIEEQSAQPGATIFLALHEMGAVGDAQVLAVSPCPKIEPGTGPLVTGTFKHQADAHSHVIRLALEDQPAPTTVTSNHPYWSADRQSFIPAGDLRPGELVDTALGPKRVLSLTPLAHTGFLYNLETTEHVYRVGSVGTLVHNSCVPYKLAPIPSSQLQKKFKHAGDFGITGTANKASLEAFNKAIQSHVGRPGVQAIAGTYRGNPAVIHVDPISGLAVITDTAGNFVSGWKLSQQQLWHVLNGGKLGGG